MKRIITIASLWALGFLCLPIQAQNVQSQGISLSDLLTLLDKGESIQGQKVEMDQVNFALNSSELNASTKGYLGQILHVLQVSDRINLSISGHTDNSGKRERNLALSHERAFAVSQFFVDAGIAPGRLSNQGYGPDRPLASNETEQGREMNRRVEFEILIQENPDQKEPTRVQDVLVLSDGSRLGAYDVRRENEKVYYRQFSDTLVHILSLDRIDAIYYANGQNYSRPLPNFAGKWVNEDGNTSGITRIVISESGDQFLTRVYGKCHPEDCDWGQQSSSKTDALDKQMNVTWTKYNIIREQSIEYLPGSDRLKVITRTRYEDGSGRQSRTSEDYFRRGVPKKKGIIPNRENLQVGAALPYCFYINLGYRRWNLTGDEIFFNFVDDSPSQDRISKMIEPNSAGLTIDFGLEYNFKKVDWSLGYHAFLGKIRGGSFSTGLGYRLIDNEKMIVRPGFSFCFGKSNLNLGRIENNDSYIQINNQRYYGESVGVVLKRGLTTLNPHLTVDIPFQRFRSLRITGGYTLQIAKGTEVLSFSGLVNEETVYETKPLSASNSFLIDGESRQEFPAVFNGIYIQVGYLIR